MNLYKETLRLVSLANKRIKRMNAKGIENKALKNLGIDRFSVKGKTQKQLEQTFKDVTNFINDKSAHLKGIQSKLKNEIKLYAPQSDVRKANRRLANIEKNELTKKSQAYENLLNSKVKGIENVNGQIRFRTKGLNLSERQELNAVLQQYLSDPTGSTQELTKVENRLKQLFPDWQHEFTEMLNMLSQEKDLEEINLTSEQVQRAMIELFESNEIYTMSYWDVLQYIKKKYAPTDYDEEFKQLSPSMKFFE